MGRIATWLLVIASACGREHVEQRPRDRTQLEAAIERALRPRLGAAPRVWCVWIPPGCRVQLADGSELGVWVGVEDDGTRDLVWKLDGMLARAADVKAYLMEVLAELGAPQGVRCGARLRVMRADDRMTCELEHGGQAFVVARANGSLALEIVLDPDAGAARSEVVTIERGAELDRMSQQLDGTVDGEAQDE